MLSLIQSRFSSLSNGPGNLELVVRVGDQLHYYWRDDGPPFDWHGGDAIVADGQTVTGVIGTPCLIKSTFGRKGNFELVISLSNGSLAHLWRDNDAPGLPWHGPTPIIAQPVNVLLPNVVGQLEDAAKQLLQSLGLMVSVENLGGLSPFSVISQQPIGGTLVRPGTSVSLRVAGRERPRP